MSETKPLTVFHNDSVSAASSLPTPEYKLNEKEAADDTFIQCKLTIGAVDDPLEKEADNMADRIMRMPECSFIQKKCAHCEEEEKIQRKTLTSFIQKKENDSHTKASEGLTNAIRSTKGKGNAMPEQTKSFMESRFGTDFSSVKIHTSDYAVQMSKELNAQAFTVGSDIYFNSGKYSPDSNNGKHLLAHELAHTIQQTSHIQMTREVCPVRPRGEITSSQTPEGILPVNILTTTDSIIIQDFAVNSATLPRNVTNSIEWQRLMSNIAGNPSMRVALQGHTDCTGSDAENIRLREQRVASVTRAMPASVQSKVLFSFTTAEEYLTSNLTPEGRAGNRSVRIMFRQIEGERIQPCDQLNRAANFDELIFLVRCAEERLHLTNTSDTRRFISVLRQIYYGNASWSASQNRVWNDVIAIRPWSPGDNPTPLLGPALFGAIRRSQVVENTDFGHLLTGVDAMFNPHNVELDFGRIIWVTGLINEEWATWAGDVGSAAATWAENSLYAQRDLDALPIFNSLAGNSDLRGNVDSFAVRMSLLGIRSPQSALGRTISMNARLSDILQNYYRIDGSGLGRSRANRIRDFVTAYGGVISGSRITNPADMIDRMLPSVQEFAHLFFMQNLLRRGYFSDDTAPNNAPEYLQRGVENMTVEFVLWLERNL